MNSTKSFFLLFTAQLFLSCNNYTKPIQEINLNIKTYLKSIESKFPGYENNTVIRDEMNQFLKNDFKKAIGNNIFNDLPFKLERVEKCNKRYMLNLEYTKKSQYDNDEILDKLEIELYAETDEKTAKSLKEGELYIVSAKFLEYLNLQNQQNYCALILMSPFIGYTENDIEFGAIGAEIKNIRAISE